MSDLWKTSLGVGLFIVVTVAGSACNNGTAGQIITQSQAPGTPTPIPTASPTPVSTPLPTIAPPPSPPPAPTSTPIVPVPVGSVERREKEGQSLVLELVSKMHSELAVSPEAEKFRGIDEGDQEHFYSCLKQSLAELWSDEASSEDLCRDVGSEAKRVNLDAGQVEQLLKQEVQEEGVPSQEILPLFSPLKSVSSANSDSIF